MDTPGRMIAYNYDPDSARLSVWFDSLQEVVFEQVPYETAALLFEAAKPDKVLRIHVLGRFICAGDIDAFLPQKSEQVA
jgi:hypothetical protein